MATKTLSAQTETDAEIIAAINRCSRERRRAIDAMCLLWALDAFRIYVQRETIMGSWSLHDIAKSNARVRRLIPKIDNFYEAMKDVQSEIRQVLAPAARALLAKRQEQLFKKEGRRLKLAPDHRIDGGKRRKRVQRF